MMGARVAWTALAAVTIAAGAGAAERLRGFHALAAQTERAELRGVGFGRAGRFTLGEATGEFRRFAGSNRLLGDTFAGAGLRFTVAGPGVGGVLTGTCDADEAAYRERLRHGLSVTTTYALPRIDCRFALDGRPAGSLTLAEQPARGIAVAEERRGTLEWAGRTLGLRSVHRFARSPLPAGAPLGYVVEGADGPLAGVDVSRPRRVLLLPRGGAARPAAIAATTALALLWEPDAG